MYHDFAHKRPLELEAIYARPLAAANAAGCELPRIETLYRHLGLSTDAIPESVVLGEGMANNIDDKLVLAISSRALFDLSESHKVYLSSGVEAYRQYQIEHEDEILAPGDAFLLVEKLLSLNSRLGRARVEVILVSRNSADTGLRVFNSIHHYGLHDFSCGVRRRAQSVSVSESVWLRPVSLDSRRRRACGAGRRSPPPRFCPVAPAARLAMNCVSPSTVMR